MRITLDIKDSIINDFNKYAQILGQDRDLFIQQALLEKLEDLDDYLYLKNRLESGDISYKTLEQVEKEIELEDFN
jgi:hypothetical protein